MLKGWEGGSVRKMLAAQTEIQAWTSAPTEKPGMVTHTCNPIVLRVETGEALELASQPSLISERCLTKQRRWLSLL